MIVGGVVSAGATTVNVPVITLSDSLVSANVPVAQFHEVQTDLEDAFLTVTKEDRAKMV